MITQLKIVYGIIMILFLALCIFVVASLFNHLKKKSYQPLHAQAREKFYSNLERKPWAMVVQKHKKEQQDNEQKIMNDFYNFTGLNEQKFNDLKTMYYPLYMATEQKQECSTKALFNGDICKDNECAVKEFLELHEMCIPSMRFVPSKDLGGPAVTTQSALYLDEKKLVEPTQTCLTPTAKAILLHEMQHVLHDDSFNKFVIQSILFKMEEKNPKLADQVSSFISRFDKFTEHRADIFAGLVDSACTKDLAAFYYQWVAQGQGDVEFATHPTYRTRHAYLDQLHKEIEQCLKR